jgi:hypothetical protein
LRHSRRTCRVVSASFSRAYTGPPRDDHARTQV